MANALLFMSDEHNPFYSSVYGHPAVQTPNMQGLADRGTVFQNAYCPSPLCMPCRSAFMSGRRVHEIQTYNNCVVNVDPSPSSYGAELVSGGVHSVYIGKADVYAPPEDLGFSEVILGRGRKAPGDTNQRRRPLAIREGAARRADGYGPRADAGAGDLQCVDAAVTWIGERAAALSQPWTLTVNVSNPHFPHLATPDLWEMYPDGEDLPRFGADSDSAAHPYAADLRAHFETEGFTDEQVRGLRRGYLACVTFVDRQLGRLMEALTQAGLLETTDVIYASDHGDMLGKFGLWWKCSLYEDSARVPCIAAGPSYEAGARVATPVDLHDVQAALFAASGASRPSDWVGTPLSEIPLEDEERAVFSEYHGHGTRGSSYMIRRGKWKYIHYIEAPHQLFDLVSDPDELTNLADDLPDVVDDLLAELLRICNPVVEDRRAESFIEGQLAAIVGETAG